MLVKHGDTEDTERRSNYLLNSNPRLWRFTSLFNDCEDVFFGHDEELFAVELDFGAGVAGEEDFVALADGEGGAFAGVEALAVADGDDLAALGLFLGGIGEDNSALGLGFGFNALDEDLVSERAKLWHGSISLLDGQCSGGPGSVGKLLSLVRRN